MFRYKGYIGKYLRIDLTRRKVEICELSEGMAENYLGGNGFGTKILWDEVPENIDPLSAKNKIIFATGPLTGTIWPSSGRLSVISKSPLTGIYGDASSGGFFAPELKYAGFDFIIVEGKSAKPVYLRIEDGICEIKDAKHIWGKDTYQTEEILRTELGDIDIKVAAIGPAGENLVRFAAINVTYGRTAARSGMGCVMGSKKLKAIAVRGTGKITVYDRDRFCKEALNAHKLIRENEFTKGETRFGTPALVSLMSEVGRFPTKNFQLGHFEYVNDISAETLEKNHTVKHLACFACPIGCDKRYIVKEGEYAGTATTSLEYETLSGFGSRCFNRNLPAIIKADEMCNRLGMDTISAGAVISFAMELYEKKIISKEDTDGLDLTWGNYKSILSLLEKICNRQGFGNILAEGSRRASKIIGHDANYYSMDVKGQEIAAQDGRSQQSMGLAHVTSSRGADHLKGFPTIDETGYPGEAIKRYGKDKLPEIIDGIQTKYKPFVVKDGEEFCAVSDSAVVCKFGTMFPPALYWAEIANGVKYAAGIDVTVEKLKKIGERIYNLQRCYNILHGISRKDDTLPKRLLTEKSPSKRAKGHIVYLKPMLEEYYRLRDWDIKTGYPKKKKLLSLGLNFVLKKLKFSFAHLAK
ncbi:MAG: aldehyde ferredoxin oxidoreductase family protein [Elusimicrobiota bacterium]